MFLKCASLQKTKGKKDCCVEPLPKIIAKNSSMARVKVYSEQLARTLLEEDDDDPHASWRAEAYVHRQVAPLSAVETVATHDRGRLDKLIQSADLTYISLRPGFVPGSPGQAATKNYTDQCRELYRKKRLLAPLLCRRGEQQRGRRSALRRC